MSDSLHPHKIYSPWNSQGHNTGVGSLSLLQEIFPTQRLNSGLLHSGRFLYQLSHKGSPRILEWVAYPLFRGSSWPRSQTGISCIAGGFFTNWAMREAWYMGFIKSMLRWGLLGRFRFLIFNINKFAFVSFFLIIKNNTKSSSSCSHSTCVCMISNFSCVQLFPTLWTVAHQAPLSTGFRQKYWSGLSCPPSSWGSSQHRDWTHVSYVSCIGRWVLYQ